MSLSCPRTGTLVFYNHSSANERVPAAILGPSQRLGDCLCIRNEVKGTWSPSYDGTPDQLIIANFVGNILW